MYTEKCNLDAIDPVSEWYYREIFKTKFNLGFGNPKSDVCSKCDAQQGGIAHKEAAKRAHAAMKSDRDQARQDGGPIYITFDLQKTLPLPKIPTSIAFYLRQLWMYNLGVHLVTANLENGYMQTWLENEAGRGANEICSALLAFLEVASEQLRQSKHLIAWSDSCGGQNKNFTVVTFWQYVLSTKRFEVIDHKFPEVGHSYMDSDRDFGLIEKATSKIERIYSAEEYRKIILDVKVRKQPFIVQNISGGLIDANKLKKVMRLQKRQRTISKEVVEFRNIRWLRVDELGFYKYRLSFDETEEWKVVDIRGREFDPSVQVDWSIPELSICAGRPINAAKVADLKKQLQFIPRIHHGFFNSITSVDEANMADSCLGSDDDRFDEEY